MRFNSLEEWLAWLEQLHPRTIELGLARIGKVARALGLFESLPKIITVAGTNGKGSCVAAMEQLLLASGHRVGAYTSPHLLHYCERIRLQGQPVSAAAVCAAFARIDGARGDTSLTYFEFGTLAAMDIFLRPPQGAPTPDVILLEVGLGGRLDAVNLWDADVAVVTSIALDHQAWLGNDREVIGREKAGVFRAGRPAICADPQPPASIAAAVAEVGACPVSIGRDFDAQLTGNSWRFSGLGTQGEVHFDHLDQPALPLPSVAAALQALFCVDMTPPEATLRKVLPRMALPGRLQALTYRGVDILLDVAHNPAAAAYLSRQLQRRPAAGVTHGVVAMMADKDLEGSLGALTGEVDRWYVAGLEGVERAASAGQLQQVLTRQHARVNACDTVREAFTRALDGAAPGDRVLVMGSFFTVAAVLAVCRDNAE